MSFYDKEIQKVLEYADPKYTHAVLRRVSEDADELWTLEESKEAADNRVIRETEAYDNDAEFQFCAKAISRHVLPPAAHRSKPLVSIYLVDC